MFGVCVCFLLHWLGGGAWRLDLQVIAPGVADLRISGSSVLMSTAVSR